MGGFFRIDGPFYKFGNMIYYLLVYNILWIIFSLPVFTIGASTTALFYVMGKVVRDEDFSTFKDFWKSFKMNFKQSTIITLILAVLYLILYVDLKNISAFGSMAKIIMPAQFAVVIELVFITLYIFPILSRFDMPIKNLFKTAFFMSNKHIFSTITCATSIVAIVFLIYKVPGLFIMMPFSLYGLAVSYILNNVFRRYIPEENDEEIDEEFSIAEDTEDGNVEEENKNHEE